MARLWRVIDLLVPAALSLSSAAALATTPAAVSAVNPATILQSRQWTFVSKVNGHNYRVQVALPVGPAPAAGYPVLYVTDGAGFFGSFSDVVRMRTLGNEVAPAVVVGISYPEDDIMVQMTRRSLDLTHSDGDAEMKARMPTGAPPAEYAGADNFLRIIQTEIKPRVSTLAKVDPSRSILYGHSLGGLFALHVLFTHPDDFRTYLISSPSIWWHGKDVLTEEATFSRAVIAGKVAPRIFVTVGGDEQTVPPPPWPAGMTQENLEKMTASAAMIDNAQALAARLATLKGSPGYVVQSKVFAGESHMSVPFASFNTLAKFALPPK